MVARPSDTTQWADGTDRRLEPAAGEKSSGFNEGTRTPARKGNWIVGLCADWIAYFAAIIDSNEEHTYQAVKTRRTFITAFAAAFDHPSWDTVEGSAMAVVGGDDGGTPRSVMWTLENHLPSGAHVTKLQAVVHPGVARSAGQRMKLQWKRENVDVFSGDLTRSMGGPFDVTEDNGAEELQSIAATVTINVDRSYSEVDSNVYNPHHVEVVSGDSATNDTVYALLVEWEDPGPRNF